MNIEDIKEQYSMKYVLDKCGIQIDRHGFCNCPLHKGDDTASMKVYEKDFYCFGCGKGGDFITFVKLYQGLNFQGACEWISGEELTKKSKTQIAVAKIKRKERENALKRTKQELQRINDSFSGLWHSLLTLEPFSDEWTKAHNKWQLLCYKQEQLLIKLGVI